jgi:hypothetical protein
LKVKDNGYNPSAWIRCIQTDQKQQEAHFLYIKSTLRLLDTFMITRSFSHLLHTYSSRHGNW